MVSHQDEIEPNEYIIGIDLGTTNSVVAVLNPNKNP